MSWPIKYHAERPENINVGDMFPAPWLEEHREFWLSAQFDRDWLDKRPPLVVRLPGGFDFCVDGPYRSKSDPNPTRQGWDVTGAPPNITLQPSINIGGMYHGWIRDGVITDDCEGRTFP